MPRKRENAQLRQQLNAQDVTRKATMKDTLIVTCLVRVLQTLMGCIQVMAFVAAVWLGCGGLEWLYHKYPLPTVSILFFALSVLVCIEAIRWRGER